MFRPYYSVKWNTQYCIYCYNVDYKDTSTVASLKTYTTEEKGRDVYCI